MNNVSVKCKAAVPAAQRTVHLNYTDRTVNVVRVIMVFAVTTTRNRDTLFGQDAENLKLDSGGTYNYHCSKGSSWSNR